MSLEPEPRERNGQAEARLLGMPVGTFGLFASGLLAVSLGLAAFCGSCFVAILSILVYNSASAKGGAGHPIDFADSYRYVALPVGIATLAMSAVVLAVLWVRRQVRG